MEKKSAFSNTNFISSSVNSFCSCSTKSSCCIGDNCFSLNSFESLTGFFLNICHSYFNNSYC